MDLGHTDTDYTTALHAPSIGLVVAGDAAYNDVHLYLVESNAQQRQEWIAALDKLEALKPRAVVASHKRPENADSPRIIAETRQYIRDFDRLAATTRTAQQLYDSMLALYPKRINPGWALWSSAQAVKPSSSRSKSASLEARTQFLEVKGVRYAFRRFGSGAGVPLLLLQHFTGTLDNWDPALTDALAAEREVILFDNAGVGRSSGAVPTTIAEMTKHAVAFLDGLGVRQCDVLGFSLGGMIAQQMALDRPTLVRRLILVGTAPRGGQEIMTLQTPRIARALQDPTNKGYTVLQKIFFPESPTAQAAGAAFVERLGQRTIDLEPPSGPAVAGAQMAAFREWDQPAGERFAYLKAIQQPTLVLNGVFDEMIPVRNSYWLAEHLANAVMLIYPDAGHASLFQYHASFARHANAFLSGASASAVY